MIRVTITDEAMKDLFLREGGRVRPMNTVKGIPDEATIVSSRVIGPSIMEMIWDLHDGVTEVTPVQIEIQADMATIQQMNDAGIV